MVPTPIHMELSDSAPVGNNARQHGSDIEPDIRAISHIMNRALAPLEWHLEM